MSYYNKNGNIITLKSGRSTILAAYLFIFEFLFFLVYFSVCLFSNLYLFQYIFFNSKNTDKVEILFFIAASIITTSISIALIKKGIKSIKYFFYPSNIKINLESKILTFENVYKNQIYNYNFFDFNEIKIDSINIPNNDDELGYVHQKVSIEGDKVIIYLSDRNNFSFDLFDLKNVSRYLIVPILENSIEMNDKEYNTFRKLELKLRIIDKKINHFLN